MLSELNACGPVPRLLPIEDPAEACVAPKNGEVDVVEAGHVEEEPEGFSVFGQIGDAGLEGLMRRGDRGRSVLERTSPEVIGAAPKIRCASSVRPAPTRPASPSTSPA